MVEGEQEADASFMVVVCLNPVAGPLPVPQSGGRLKAVHGGGCERFRRWLSRGQEDRGRAHQDTASAIMVGRAMSVNMCSS